MIKIYHLEESGTAEQSVVAAVLDGSGRVRVNEGSHHPPEVELQTIHWFSQSKGRPLLALGPSPGLKCLHFHI